MYPGVHAVRTPEKIAAVMAETGESITYRELENRSVRLAHVLHDAGLRPGDVVALLTENNLRAFEVYWAALRSGLFITAVSDSSSPEEIAYIVNDSGAKALVVSVVRGDLGLALSTRIPDVGLRLVFGGELDGYASYEDAIAEASDIPFEDQPQGAPMLYSSGTTGRPKGIRPLLPPVQVDEPGDPLVALLRNVFGLGEDTVYLSPAPIYHTAPLRWSGAVQAFGGTVVMLRKFDARAALATIERYGVTYAQFVPTMFVRMLKLPEEVRASYDLSSLTGAVHAAAPCPVEVKDKMIAWWGPILDEYYGGTEGIGVTVIDSENWLAKRGSVGKPVLGTVRVCADETGDELPVGETGIVYFERERLPFEYHNDPERTRDAQHPLHPNWSTLGDIGHVDADGYLFLTDRKSFMIISGGVNIYPQEIENALVLHPAIHDVAVIGIPDAEMGESVKAFVQPAPGAQPGPALAEEIIAFVKSRIASYKAPRSVEFVERLPRTETGKLLKADLKKSVLG